MHAGKTPFVLSIILIILLCILSAGCQSPEASSLSKEAQKLDKTLSGKMLHLKQVVELYDEQSSPVPHYYEMWIAKDKAYCKELNKEGNILQKLQDDGKLHISYDPIELKAVKHDSSRIFALKPGDLGDMKEYGVAFEEDYEYCKRACRAYSMSNGRDEEELRLYADEETGYVLFCDAPLFCIKTTSFEVLPYDAAMFSIPEGIRY